MPYWSLSVMFVIPFFGFAKTHELVPDYTVSKPVKDPTLKSGEAKFVFTFDDGSSVVAEQEIRMSYNKKEVTLKTNKKGIAELKLKAGNYEMQFFLNENYNEIYTGSIKATQGSKTAINVSFHSSEFPIMVEKPVIYLYSDKQMDAEIKLDIKNKLIFTYPEYNNGWNVHINTDGKISVGNREYPYLFWEASAKNIHNKRNPFRYYVKKENLVLFFEEKLTEMGFNEREQTDFITYWAPRMTKYEKTAIIFRFNEEINEIAKLDISPEPQSIFRLYMEWEETIFESVSDEVELIVLPKIDRNGFSVVEWGGAELTKLKK